jgi:hypothetical protein
MKYTLPFNYDLKGAWFLGRRYLFILVLKLCFFPTDLIPNVWKI